MFDLSFGSGVAGTSCAFALNGSSLWEGAIERPRWACGGRASSQFWKVIRNGGDDADAVARIVRHARCERRARHDPCTRQDRAHAATAARATIAACAMIASCAMTVMTAMSAATAEAAAAAAPVATAIAVDAAVTALTAATVPMLTQPSAPDTKLHFYTNPPGMLEALFARPD